MAKKVDLRGKNASRNVAGRETIQNSAAFQALVGKTKEVINNSKGKPLQNKKISYTDNEVNSVVDKIVGSNSVSANYEKIPLSKLKAAPIEWNYFSALSNEKKALMAESIYYNGLLQPIIVRSLNKDNTEYEILAGHHRTEAFAVLREITNDSQYDQIDAKVFPFGALTDTQAREIVEDTNFIQRGNLSAKDKALCIYNKAQALRFRGAKGDIMGLVADHFGITRTTVFFWKKIVDLIPDFERFFSEGNINIISAAKIAGFPPAVQEQLYQHKELVTNESISKIKASDDPGEILNKLKKFSEPNAGNYYGNIIESKISQSGITITTDKQPPASMKAILLYIPEKKLSVFQKKYGEYIIEEKLNTN